MAVVTVEERRDMESLDDDDSYASPHDLMIQQPLRVWRGRLGIQRATCSDFWEVLLRGNHASWTF